MGKGPVGCAVVIQTSLDRLACEAIIDARVAPAAALGVAVRGASGWRHSVGCAGSTPSGPVTPDTLFDLASVTKPFVALLFTQLLARGAVRRDTPLGALVDEARGEPAADRTLEQLLSHRAGLLAHQPLYAPLVRREAFRRRTALAIAARSARPEIDEGGSSALYSDLGYLLAGEMLVRAASAPLDDLMEELVCAPLGCAARSARGWMRSCAAFLGRVAPTEYVAFRGGLLRGVVHDENAWAFAGHALAGHAGLFGTVDAVLRFGTAILDALASRSAFLTAEHAQMLVQERRGGSLRLGFDGKSGSDSSAGPSASLQTFGHLGFTGTSLWCDPVAERVTVLLTNRVCPTRENIRIRSARPRVHEALFGNPRPISPE